MVEQFEFDVFLSHHALDRDQVRLIAERLSADGLKVWFDPWIVNNNDERATKIEYGLEHSRVMVLCVSGYSLFESNWAELERQTLRFRDPANSQRRFVSLLLDDSTVVAPLAQFPFFRWNAESPEDIFAKLLEACRSLTKPDKTDKVSESPEKTITFPGGHSDCYAYAFDATGKQMLAAAHDVHLRLWDLDTRVQLRSLEGHTGGVTSILWTPDKKRALSGSFDNTVRLWNVETGECLRVLEGHTQISASETGVTTVAWNVNEELAFSGGHDRTVRVWDLKTG